MGDDGVRAGRIEVGIVVRNLDRAAAFYRDVLQLDDIGDLDVPVGVMRRFAKGDAVVKLLHLHETPEHANPAGGPAAATGIRYLTVRVDDVESGVRRSLDAGFPVPVPTFEYEPGFLVAIVADPEGNWVELVQA